jgi:hypothetical protein
LEPGRFCPAFTEDDPEASGALSNLIELAVSDLSRRHGIPEEWLFSGAPEEIEC